MLVLSRKVGESIVVNGDIEITVLDVSGSKVKLGFKAPSHIAIVREDAFGVSSGARNSSGNGNLVIRQKVGQRVLIGDNIVVTTVKVYGGRVRLGFAAPRNISVVRQEKMPPNNALQSA